MALPGRPKGEKGETPAFTEFLDAWYPIQVKQKEKVGRPDIDSFEAVMAREERQRGFFVSFDYTADAEQECAAFHKKTGRIIKQGRAGGSRDAVARFTCLHHCPIQE